jgi:hypothetical protein
MTIEGADLPANPTSQGRKRKITPVAFLEMNLYQNINLKS